MYDATFEAELIQDRKTFALAIKDKPSWLKAALFKMLDGRDYADVIWKNLEPVGGGEVIEVRDVSEGDF